MQHRLLPMRHLHIIEYVVVGEEFVHLLASAIIVKVLFVEIAHLLDVLQYDQSRVWVVGVVE